MSTESAPAEWTPSFPGQRPPFVPGHEVSVQHGAYSPRKVDPLAESFVTLILQDPAAVALRSPLWRPALWAWARAEAQVQLLTEYLATHAGDEGVGDLEADRIKAAYLLLHRAEARAMAGRRQLGLDPLSAARLGRDRAAEAVDTARVMQELAAAEAARQDREGGE